MKKILWGMVLLAFLTGVNFYFRQDAPGVGSSGLLERASSGIAGLWEPDAGPAASQHKYDVADSPYFKSADVYHLTSGGSLLLLEKYATKQQESAYTCGPAAAWTVVRHFLGSVPETEKEIAGIMGTRPAGMKDPGTNVRGMSRYFEAKGWIVKNSLNNGSPKTYRDFLQFVDANLKNKIPIMVENVDWGGHWRVIIGHDTMGDRENANDVLVLADPYDTTDHLQDGYGFVSAQRFYYMWFDAQLFREGERLRPWLTAVPPDRNL